MSQPVDAGLPNPRFPFPAYSDGWARVALSQDVEPGDVEPLRYFGRDLVLFRAHSGQVHVLDAHCPHLGAHMGHGGRVEGDSLRCPFHAWRWAGDGSCVEIPYASRIPARARVGAWPTCERNGFVFIWYHGAGTPPSEQVPELPEVADPEWSDFTRLRWKIRARAYDMGENTVDDVHFRYLHGAASLPKSEQGDLMGTASVRSNMKMDSPLGEVDASIENTAVPGMGIVHLTGICDTLIVITSAPIDGEYVDQMFSYSQRTHGDSRRERMGKAFLRDLEKQMNEDIVCFENKRYFVRPLFCDGDGPIAEYRRRSKKRYTGSFPGSDPHSGTEWDSRTPPVARGLARAKSPLGFSARDFDELSSFLRSTFRVRQVERTDHDRAGTVELRLLGREDALKHHLVFERDCLARHEVADLRSYLARPLVKQRIAAAGVVPFEVPSIEIE